MSRNRFNLDNGIGYVPNEQGGELGGSDEAGRLLRQELKIESVAVPGGRVRDLLAEIGVFTDPSK